MDRELHDTLAIVLGGGPTSGLWPLTEERCRPAIPFGGRYRLIDVTISNCINSQVPRVFVLTQFNSESLNRHINLTYRFDYFTHGFVEVLSAEQREDAPDWSHGSANAIRHAWPRLTRYGARHVLVLPGEHIYKLDYRNLLDLHVEQDADVSVLVAPVGYEKTSTCGLFKTDRTSTVTDFVEKPQDETIVADFRVDDEQRERNGISSPEDVYWANMGIYLFKASVLETFLADDGLTDIGRHVLPRAVAGTTKVLACCYDGYWENIGSMRSFFEANLRFADKNPPFSIYDAETPVYTNPRFLPSSKLFGSQVSNTLLADGCVIEHSDLHDCVIGQRSFIRSGSTLKNVVMMGADHFERLDELRHNAQQGLPNLGLGHHCIIENTIIDRNARIGQHVRIVNVNGVSHADGDGWVIRDGIVIIRKNAVLLDGTVI